MFRGVKCLVLVVKWQLYNSWKISWFMSFDDRKPFILLSGKSDILKFAFFQLSEFSESQILFTDQRVNGDNARIFQHFIEIKGLEFILSLFDHSWWFVGILDPLLSNIKTERNHGSRSSLMIKYHNYSEEFEQCSDNTGNGVPLD